MSSTKTKDGWVWDGTWPHCDHRVVHAPGECHICDQYAPLLQFIRKAWNINFTNHHDMADSEGHVMLPCPAEVARPLSTINKWGGNTAKTEADLKAHEEAMKEVADHFRDI